MNHEHSHFDHRLTRDPEIRYTREGQANTTFGVAVNRRWQNKQTQEWEEAVSFFDVVTWADLGESIALSLTKGCRAIVVGRLEQRSWETSEGEKRSRVEISAEDVGPALRFATAEVSKTERREPATVGTPDTDGEEPSCAVYDMVINCVEKPLIETVLHHAGGNQTRAAELLGLNRNTLRKKMQSHKIKS